MIFGEGRVHAIKRVFLQKVSPSLVKPLLVTRNSHHHEILVLFLIRGDTVIGLIKVAPEDI